MIRGKRSQGFSLLEVMAAVTVLAVGLLACSSLIVMGMAGNTRNQNDSGGTLLSQMVIEQINTLSANSGSFTLTDCNGTAWTVKMTAASQTSGGAGASTDPTFGGIDFTQAQASVPAGYQMNYVMCASQQNKRATYDVRWNVMSINGEPNVNLVTVSARQTATANGTPIMYSQPVTLRTIQGLQ